MGPSGTINSEHLKAYQTVVNGVKRRDYGLTTICTLDASMTFESVAESQRR